MLVRDAPAGRRPPEASARPRPTSGDWITAAPKSVSPNVLFSTLVGQQQSSSEFLGGQSWADPIPSGMGCSRSVGNRTTFAVVTRFGRRIARRWIFPSTRTAEQPSVRHGQESVSSPVRKAARDLGREPRAMKALERADVEA